MWKKQVEVSCFCLSVPHIQSTVKGENVPQCYHPSACPPHQWPALNSEAPCLYPPFPFLSSLVSGSNPFLPSLCFLIVGVMAAPLNCDRQCYTRSLSGDRLWTDARETIPEPHPSEKQEEMVSLSPCKKWAPVAYKSSWLLFPWLPGNSELGFICSTKMTLVSCIGGWVILAPHHTPSSLG